MMLRPEILLPTKFSHRLPTFCRTSWVSDAAFATWRPRFSAVQKAWSEIEKYSVVEGVRDAAIVYAESCSLVDLSDWAIDHGLAICPIRRERLGRSSYQSSSEPPKEGDSWQYAVVVCRGSLSKDIVSAIRVGDDQLIGKCLGYPACCSKFFEFVWGKSRYVDTTWPMACNSDSMQEADKIGVDNMATDVRDVRGPFESNILLRWLGVRAVSHLPCGFSCRQTVETARELSALGKAMGFDREEGWKAEMLDWPMSWSALHGIGELVTPVFKTTFNTDSTAKVYTVRKHGSTSPVEAAQGLSFPFRIPAKRLLSSSPAYKRGLENPIAEKSTASDWLFTDNGFLSEFDMRAAHRRVAKVAGVALSKEQGAILDLGCGNGALLKVLCRLKGGLKPHGIDSDASKIVHARELSPEYARNFHVGNMFDVGLVDSILSSADFALVLLMPGRLLEVAAVERQGLMKCLSRSGTRILVYAYGDWLHRYGALGPLAREAGFIVRDDGQNPHALIVQAGVYSA